MKKLYLLNMDVERLIHCLDELESIVRDSGEFDEVGDEAYFGVSDMESVREFLEWKEQITHRLSQGALT